MKISYEQVQAFVAVADTGSFSAAGKLLGKHRTTLGQIISNLEIETNMTLFDRSGRYPSLTLQGETLYQQAKALSVASSAFEQLCLYQAKGIETELNVYYSEQLPDSVIVKTMIALHKHYPKVRVHWRKDNNQQILSKLEQNQADLALVICPNGNSVTSIEFSYIAGMPYTLCASPSFVELHRPQGMVSLQQLPQLTLTDFYSSGIDRSICTSNHIQQFDSMRILTSLLINGEGWAILPRHAVIEAINNGDLIQMDIQALQGTLRFPVVSWQASKMMGPVASFILEQFKAFAPTLESV
ncbi:LysR family transcriptional regulator [Thaumasiovibrio subtropicus]|uniref:LysR family transcriptional regulator n=1 Tax=Thaumasiovibrio subtropicus TaxID=1891207 RepID=UPI000B35831A|nr:LysR family transcriptional regulator [Thaumasiovibrio subtropicus]